MSLATLNQLADSFVSRVEPHLGLFARPNGTFFSYRVATMAIQRLRLDVMQNGKALSESGEQFLADAAAYLGRLALENWRRRNLDVQVDARFDGDRDQDAIRISASRTRNGEVETYEHDFLKDARELLIHPPEWFPWIHGQVYAVQSIVLPSPEYLLMYGAFLMQSPRDQGNWPKPGPVGGIETDMEQSKQLLIDDLHTDCGLPVDNEAMRKLSLWIVFPPYGWHMNEGQDYNMMTIFDQISNQGVIEFDEGVRYLRGLLRCQALYLQNLAARCLLVYRQPPNDAFEAEIYRQSLAWRDYREASPAMAKYQWQLEGGKDGGPTQAWLEEVEQERQAFADRYHYYSLDDPAFRDPDYIALESLSDEALDEGIAGLARLIERYPDSWNLRTLHASQMMKRSADGEGERLLRAQIAGNPPQPEAHLRLGTLLKYEGRMADSLEVYQDGLRRWPRHSQLADSCLWNITEGMTVDRPTPPAEDLMDWINQMQNAFGQESNA